MVRQKAIEIVQGAIEADKKQDYDEAYKLYSNALDYFMLALKCMCDDSVPCKMLILLRR